MFDFFRKKTESKGLSVADLSGSFLSQVFYGGKITPYKAAEFYRSSSAVAIAVDTIAKEVEQIEPVVELSDGLLDDNHSVLSLLQNPNEFEDYRAFIGQLCRNYLLNHDAYLYAEGSVRSAPAALFTVNNQNLSVVENTSDGYPDRYLVTSKIGKGTYNRTKRNRQLWYYSGTLQQLHRVHGYSSRSDNCFADSPLEAAALEARQQILGKNHNLRLISNGGKLSMAVLIKGDTPPTQEQFNEIEQRVMERFSGSDNAGKIAVFGANDLEVKEMGMTNKDMDFAAMQETSANAIYSRYSIPLPLVSPDRQTFNNFDRAIEDLYDRAVVPYAKVLFSGLTKVLRPRFGDSFERITYNPERIEALKGRMLAELKTRREVNIETVNELRQGLPNREPLEGGDIYYQPATLIPAGEDLATDDDPVRESPADAIDP